VVSAGIVAVLFLAMAYLVRSEVTGRALGAAALAVVVVVMFSASLLGNWGVESAGTRALDALSTLVAVAASILVFVVALRTARHSRPPHSRALS
jgi:hypothetical protein